MGTTAMNDEYNLQRFIEAQNPVYDDALTMLRRGLMCTAYIDFIFPRLLDRGADRPRPMPSRRSTKHEIISTSLFSAADMVNASPRRQ
jgi:uncharacterized protein (DUF1810 family)